MEHLEFTKYSFDRPRHQNYSLSFGYTNYIFKNQTPLLYKKLIMSCKSIFIKKRILLGYTGGDSDSCCDLDNIPFSLKKLEDNKISLWITRELHCENPEFNGKEISNLFNNSYLTRLT